LGLQTTPKDDQYDVVIAGAGPAGMAAGVYGASEGSSVLIVERSAAGGQAGTSSRIENYLGFPSGISGDELTERALKQARHFGSEIAVTRSIEAVLIADTGYSVRNRMAETAYGLAPFYSRPVSIGVGSNFRDSAWSRHTLRRLSS
jgi:thioredoxin reductase (NADPH)